MKANLVLADGTIYPGEAFGAPLSAAGEVVFTTAMTGYVETLTDPSYTGQIVVLTYPLIGNYGVPQPKFFQSNKIQVAGLIVASHCLTPSHQQSQKTLTAWLKENRVPAIAGIDTRTLTQNLRNQGTILGKIEIKKAIPFYDPNRENLVNQVSLKKPVFFKKSKAKKTICLLDCGYKKAILDNFLSHDLNVWVVPWDFDPFEKGLRFAGLVISNGPGDPQMADKTIATVREAIKKNLPVLGICLGNQILGLAAGATTYKLKFGHRSANQPVKNNLTSRCFITSQNHGFAIDQTSLPAGWQIWFTNLNDHTCEGIISQNKKFLGVQFHPEGHPGPEDTQWVFEEFIKNL